MSEQEVPEVQLPELAGGAVDEAVELRQVLEDRGIIGPHTMASQLVDETFIITAAKAFESSFQEGDHAYFCTCVDPESGEVFTTVLGGQAVVEMIDLYIAAGGLKPIKVTLRLKQGGRYGRYYYLE